MEILLVAGAAGLIVMAMANAKGAAPVPWFVYGALLPPVAFLHILLRPGRIACEACAERILAAARVCPNCGAAQAPREAT